MSVTLKALILGLSTALFGAACSLVPAIGALEQGIGLDWLFRLRGPRPAPPEVVVVNIDQASSRWFGLANEPRKWPRSYHARVVDKLVAAGARVIAFDVIFDEPREEEGDRSFAEALRKAGNVVLFQYLRKETLANRAGPDGAGATVEIEGLVPPLAPFAQAAAALAPFPLPKVPAKVSQAWTFKPGAGDVATLPVAVFQLYLHAYWDDLCSLIRRSVLATSIATLCPDRFGPGYPDAAALASRLRELFQNDPSLEAQVRERLAGNYPEAEARALSRLIALYAGPNNLYLDLYGPPLSIRTIPYYQVIESSGATELDLRGKAVFLGFSEQLQPEQKDGFYTVFSQADGLDVSGVEIAATAFANLLEGRSVRPPPGWANLLIILAWGLAVGVVLRMTPGVGPLIAAVLFAGAGLGLAYLAFSRDGTWLPIVVPLLFQLPFALVGALLWQYLATRQERRMIREAFGYFLPDEVVDELARNVEDMPSKGKLVYGVCLCTDVEAFTHVSERLPPESLRTLLNRYFDVLFEPVRRHGGIVCDVAGDAMMAAWTASRNDVSVRQRACRAALEIHEAVSAFNRSLPALPLPTRIGLHGGDILLGNVGARHHFEYRAVGDIVNTSSRIEGLNKQLGTRVLATLDVIDGVDDLKVRELGRFRLAGKSTPLAIYELRDDDSATKAFDADFAAALHAFQAQRWDDAATRFEELLSQRCDDGPSRFYLDLARRYASAPPPAPWDGVVNLTRK